ncbi:hypothetical protein CLF_108450, partial [Clonorchis sinensis]
MSDPKVVSKVYSKHYAGLFSATSRRLILPSRNNTRPLNTLIFTEGDIRQLLHKTNPFCALEPDSHTGILKKMPSTLAKHFYPMVLPFKRMQTVNSSGRWTGTFPLNGEKCVHIPFGGDSANARAKKGEKRPEDITRTDSKKDLGIWLSPNLSFSLHLEKSAQKAFAILRMVQRTSSHIDHMDSQIPFGAYVRPLLEYAKQFVYSDTRRTYRAGQQPSLLDLVIINERHFVDQNRNVLFKYMRHRRRNKPSAFSLRDRNGEPTSDPIVVSEFYRDHYAGLYSVPASSSHPTLSRRTYERPLTDLVFTVEDIRQLLHKINTSCALGPRRSPPKDPEGNVVHTGNSFPSAVSYLPHLHKSPVNKTVVVGTIVRQVRSSYRASRSTVHRPVVLSFIPVCQVNGWPLLCFRHSELGTKTTLFGKRCFGMRSTRPNQCSFWCWTHPSMDVPVAHPNTRFLIALLWIHRHTHTSYGSEATVVKGLKVSQFSKRNTSLGDSCIDPTCCITFGSNTTCKISRTLHNFECLSLDARGKLGYPAVGTIRRPMWHEMICKRAVHACTLPGILSGYPELDRKTIRVLYEGLWLESLT